MLGTQRATMYGYSLWEFEVYGGGGGSTGDHGAGQRSLDHGWRYDAQHRRLTRTLALSPRASPAISRTFTVRNDGTATLTLGAVTVPTGFTLTEGLSTSLAPGASDTFTVRLDTATVGTKSGEISFTHQRQR